MREHRSRGARESRMTRGQWVVMAIVMFAMVFSSLGMILAYGGREAALVTIGVFVLIVLVLFVVVKLRDRSEEGK